MPIKCFETTRYALRSQEVPCEQRTCPVITAHFLRSQDVLHHTRCRANRGNVLGAQDISYDPVLARYVLWSRSSPAVAWHVLWSHVMSCNQRTYPAIVHHTKNSSCNRRMWHVITKRSCDRRTHPVIAGLVLKS